MKQCSVKILGVLLIAACISILGISGSYAEDGSLIIEPVDLHFELVDASLPTITNVQQLTFFGIEYRNTTDNNMDGIISEGDPDADPPVPPDTAEIDGVLSVTSFISNGSIIIPPGFGTTWEMTGTYVGLKDVVFATTPAIGKIDYMMVKGVGILTLYVELLNGGGQLASSISGLGYDGGTMVAQFAVDEGGGVYRTIAPFDGARDFFMLKQSGLDGFFDPEITGGIYDSNLDADGDDNGIGGNQPIPTDWQYPTAAVEVNYPWSYYVFVDGSMRFGFLQIEGGECRMTGGGVDVNKNIVLGTEANSLDDRYTYGGQIGAPTASDPQPWGEWTMHQQKGTGGRFVFRSGTASAPDETMILNVDCMDPGYCKPARPAPFKQISWDGLGAFKNISTKGLNQLLRQCPAGTDITAGKDGTILYYRVHVNDIGEPGSGEVSKGKGKKSTRHLCDLQLTKEFPITSYEITDEQCANCPDTYQIEIHCTDDPASDVMYSVGAFTDGGNLQIHPPVGEHMKP